MRRLPAAVGILATVLLLTVALPTSSQAATGRFDYTGTDGVPSVIFNPPDGPCFGFNRTAVGVDNQTDTGATLYTGLACSGITEYVPPHTGLTWGTYRPNSVRFG
ncbi:hypothetical protein ACFYZ9_17875 [Streptomyces sp. NPDC001691]|uniref:hypothetical protein n=1 Tax=Streptomyces sp. NPDC001691 TaxID=3364600 RepID=UPI0036CAFEEF